MQDAIRRAAEEYAAAHAEEALALLRTLGEIPAPSRQEDRRAAFCRDWLLAQGAGDVTIDAAKNVICRLGCDTKNDVVVFAAHTDIVFPTTEPLPMREENGRLCAPGIGDDTANLVCLLMAAKYLLQNPVQLRCGLFIVANACEEGLGNLDGVKTLFADYGERIRAFYSFDGYIPQCCSSGVGSYRYRISCKTAGGHSYVDFGAPNAIQILCDLVARLYQIRPPAQARTTYNVGRIEGGTSVNTIAQEASVLYEFRSTSQECLEQMEREFRAALEACRRDGAALTVELLGVRPGDGALNRAALQRFTGRTAEVLQTYYSGTLDCGAYSTDSNVPLSLGIPANTVGLIRGGQAHTWEEWIDPNSLPDGMKIALSLLLLYTDLS